MSGTFFDYTPGRIDARFSHAPEFDYINLRIRMHSAVVKTTDCDDQFNLGRSVNHTDPSLKFTVYMTSVFCPFRDFLRFLEAIAIQVQECSFDWEPEGPDAKMEWRRRYVDDTGFLTVSWHGRSGNHQQIFSHRMMLNTRQAVRMLYTAFRRFVESPEYDPIRYEQLKAGDAFSLVLTSTADSTLEKLADKLVQMDMKSAERVLICLCEYIGQRTVSGPSVQHTLDHYIQASQEIEVEEREWGSWLPTKWNELDKAQRMTEVIDRVFCGGPPGWYGANLRSLHSPLVEEYLAGPTQPTQ